MTRSSIKISNFCFFSRVPKGNLQCLRVLFHSLYNHAVRLLENFLCAYVASIKNFPNRGEANWTLFFRLSRTEIGLRNSITGVWTCHRCRHWIYYVRNWLELSPVLQGPRHPQPAGPDDAVRAARVCQGALGPQEQPKCGKHFTSQ